MDKTTKYYCYNITLHPSLGSDSLGCSTCSLLNKMCKQIVCLWRETLRAAEFLYCSWWEEMNINYLKNGRTQSRQIVLIMLLTCLCNVSSYRFVKFTRHLQTTTFFVPSLIIVLLQTDKCHAAFHNTLVLSKLVDMKYHWLQ